MLMRTLQDPPSSYGNANEGQHKSIRINYKHYVLVSIPLRRCATIISLIEVVQVNQDGASSIMFPADNAVVRDSRQWHLSNKGVPWSPKSLILQ